MALSMEEQRILAQIEQELARSEPVLAARLSAFGHPARAALRSPHGRGWKTARGREAQSAGAKRLRSPRVLVVASLVALLLLTIIPVAVYALVSLRVSRGHGVGHPTVSAQHHAVPVHPAISPPK
jgi:hypothetical protein